MFNKLKVTKRNLNSSLFDPVGKAQSVFLTEEGLIKQKNYSMSFLLKTSTLIIPLSLTRQCVI